MQLIISNIHWAVIFGCTNGMKDFISSWGRNYFAISNSLFTLNWTSSSKYKTMLKHFSHSVYIGLEWIDWKDSYTYVGEQVFLNASLLNWEFANNALHSSHFPVSTTSTLVNDEQWWIRWYHTINIFCHWILTEVQIAGARPQTGFLKMLEDW